MKKSVSSYASSVNSFQESESPSHQRGVKVQTKDQVTQTQALKEEKEQVSMKLP
jgi:hypothetical protein